MFLPHISDRQSTSPLQVQQFREIIEGVSSVLLYLAGNAFATALLVIWDALEVWLQQLANACYLAVRSLRLMTAN